MNDSVSSSSDEASTYFSSTSNHDEDTSYSHEDEPGSVALSIETSQGSIINNLNESWISQINPLDEGCFCGPFRLLKTCSMCFGPKEGEADSHRNCFVAVDSLQESTVSPYRSYTPALARVEEHEASGQFDIPTRAKRPNIFTPLMQKLSSTRLFHMDSMRTPTRHTPLSVVGSMASNFGSINHETYASSTTLHRRADISAGKWFEDNNGITRSNEACNIRT